tara:strand:- start:1 stop:975 length:975 start_codon:yes stop_codon:yes gene_type:complete
MEINKDIAELASRVSTIKEQVQSEEGSKTALVLPMLQILGYDIFNPKQVMPELIADIGTKRGERVDYALMSAGLPKLILECKKIEDKLDKSGVSQLFRYFTALKVKFAVLTNGVTYLFFSDIETPNIMDTKPFFRFCLGSYTPADVEFLHRFRKGCLVGQMKSLRGLCKKKKLRSMVRAEITSVLDTSREFVTHIKDSLAGTTLSSVTKKELDRVCRDLTLQECINKVERHRSMDMLKPRLATFLEELLPKAHFAKLSMRQTSSSLYVEGLESELILRIYTIGLGLKISCGPLSESLRVIEDISYYKDIIKQQVAARIKKCQKK